MQRHIVLAEDDRDMRSLLAQRLEKEGYRVTECRDGLELLDQVALINGTGETGPHVDLIISDIRMPGITGMEMLRGTRELQKFPPVILITAFGDEPTHAEAARLGAAAIFDKPFDIDLLLDRVRQILSFSVYSPSGEPERSIQSGGREGHAGAP